MNYAILSFVPVRHTNPATGGLKHTRHLPHGNLERKHIEQPSSIPQKQRRDGVIIRKRSELPFIIPTSIYSPTFFSQAAEALGEDDEEETPSTAAQQTAEDEEEERRYLLDPAQKLVCRFYENQYPELEEVVMVNVRNIADMGAYVTLLEVS